VGFSDPLAATDAARRIAQDFQGFSSFNSPTVNSAVVVVEGGQAVFYLGANGPDSPGYLQGFGSNAIGNDAGATVNLSSGWNDSGTRFTQTGVTTGNHQLVGVRQWIVSVSGNFVTYGTFAFEQPRGTLNTLGFNLAGGATAQTNIWKTYLNNISQNQNFQNLVIYTHSWDTHSQNNPFIPSH
jgi:hypothetical protein